MQKLMSVQDLKKTIEAMNYNTTITIAAETDYETKEDGTPDYETCDSSGWWSIAKLNYSDSCTLLFNYCGGGYPYAYSIDGTDETETIDYAVDQFMRDCFDFSSNPADLYMVDTKVESIKQAIPKKKEFEIKDNVLVKYTGAKKDVVIPDEVTEIGNHAFSYCESFENVIIPDSVTKIGDSAFRGCTSLKEVVISDSVTEIGDSAFRGCTSLENIIVPNSVTEIGEAIFFGCTELKEITIPDSIDRISGGTFLNCRNLKEIEIPDNINEIGEAAFMNCQLLEGIIISDNVTRIEDHTFNCCISLESITFPESVVEVGKDIFINCFNLQELKVSESALKSMNMTNEQFAKHVGVDADVLNVIKENKDIERE